MTYVHYFLFKNACKMIDRSCRIPGRVMVFWQKINTCTTKTSGHLNLCFFFTGCAHFSTSGGSATNKPSSSFGQVDDNDTTQHRAVFVEQCVQQRAKLCTLNTCPLIFKMATFILHTTGQFLLCRCDFSRLIVNFLLLLRPSILQI